MCNQPIRIKNRTKYLNNQHGQPYYLWVNCGHCNECRQQKQNEWTLRTYYQALDCITNNGWIYWDTLTYNDKNLPRLTNYIETNKNWACFNYKDIRQFYETLRQYYKGKDTNIKYFITTEYGDIRKRPHIHIMLFVYNNITTPENLSLNVSKAWKKGRTDGMPYKTHNYIKEHNTMTKINLDVIRYVSKYINKSQTFTNIINQRWNKLQQYYEKTKFDKKQIEKIRKQYYRLTTPFHRQSQHFGETALLYADIQQILNDNRIFFKDDSLKIVKYASLPMFFKRKLFQTQKTINGKKIWIYNENGIYYKQYRENITIENLYTRLKDIAKTKGKNISDTELFETAKYIITKRGRLNGEIDYKDHSEDAEFYNYNSNKDEIYLGKKIISKEYLGNDKIGYSQTKNIEEIEIEKYIYIDREKEAIIEALNVEQDTKSLVLLKEHINEIRKIFFKN